MLFTLSFSAFALDTDRDLVDDQFDVCPWSDDKVDLNGDGDADCAQSMIPGGTFDVYGDIGYWSAINTGTFRNTDPLDLGGYQYSDSMLAETYGFGSAEVGHKICRTIAPPYGDDLEVWLLATLDGTGTSTAVTELRQYTSNNCTTGNSVTVSDIYSVTPNAISVSDVNTSLLSTTRSVLLIVKAGTAHQFLVDNVLMVRSPASTGGGGIDDDN